MAGSPAATKRKPVNGPAVALTVVPPLKEEGVDGIGNYGGTLTAESNPALFHIAAFGRAGTTVWGEWELRRHTDEAMAKAIDFVLAPIRDAAANVKAGGESVIQQQQADFVKWNLLEALEPGWGKFIDQSAGGALACGFSLHEKVFAACQHELLPNGQGYRIAKLAERLPSSLPSNAWKEDPNTGELKSILQHGPKAGKWTSLELPASKLLLHTWKRNGNNYAGFSAFRAVWYAMKVRESLLKLVAVSIVREGAGIPVAYAKDAKTPLSKGQRDKLIKLLQNLVYHENASVVLPAGWEMSWIYSPGANKGHVVDTFNALGLLILEQVGAQQLSLGTSGTGSRAVGQVHQTQSQMFVKGLIRSVEDLLNTDLIKDLVDFNWGAPKDGKYPTISLEPQQAGLDPEKLAKALTDGKAAGVFTPTLDDENSFRKKVCFAPIDEQTRNAEKDKAVALLPPTPPPFGGKPSNDSPFAKASLRASAAFQPRRPLRASEKALDLTSMAATFDAARENFSNGVRPLVAEMLMRVLPALKVALADGDPSEVATLKLGTKRLDAYIGKFLRDLCAEGYRQVRREKQLSRPLKAAGEEDDKYPPATPPSPSDDAQSALVPMRKHLVRKMSNRLLSDLEKEAIDVIRTGGDESEVVTRTLESQATTGAFRGDAGIVTTKAFNVGRDEFAQEFGSEVASVELSAILDNATCGPCEQLDGQEFDFNSPEHEAHVPPLSGICDGGDNCRCLLIYNFDKSGSGNDPGSDE